MKRLVCRHRQQPARTRPPKDSAPCCLALRDALGRLPIGFCSDDCIRRPA